MPKISSVQKAVHAAARDRVVRSFTRLKKHWNNGRWLGERNYYKRDTSNRVKGAQGTFKDLQLIDYIGASTLGHCFDGWSYLGRAMEAELAGDPGSARHLGYYAELRAAMSLLACEGIGIFNTSHAVVMADGTCSGFGNGKGTHKIVWEVLDKWSRTNGCTDRLLGIIRPSGIALAEWIEQFGGSAQFVTSNWLEKWGLDLRRLESDRDARNLASYRPASLSGAPPAGVEQTIAAVDELWTLCEPGGGGGFPLMDRHLLRQVLVQLFERQGDGFGVPREMGRFTQEVARMLGALGVGAEQSDLRSFLAFDLVQRPSSLLVDASGDVEADHVDHSKQVLARATLLLRLATGSVAELLKESDSDFDQELQFWWKGEAVRRRLWSMSGRPEAFPDLWDDVESALEDAQMWLSSPPAETSHWSFWTQTQQAGWLLSTVERAFLWGMA
ncbi:MAG: hypothetical protein F4X31_01550 [Gammaproteobacteria bacterium]|nr:hypothetical protein [Gammaproteobacteria bacterium]